MADMSFGCELHLLLYMQTCVSGIPTDLLKDDTYLEQLVDHITSQSMYNQGIHHVFMHGLLDSSPKYFCFAMCVSLSHTNTLRCS